MIVATAAVLVGLVFLIWSADRFVDGASGVAFRIGMSPLLVGLLIVGFATSAPEIVVSVIAAVQGNPGLALGNALGSNVANIALILGVTAVLAPVPVHRMVIKRDLPLLLLATLVLAAVMADFHITRLNGAILLVSFTAIMAFSIYSAQRGYVVNPLPDTEADLGKLTLGWSWFWLVVGLLVLTASSRALVWGAVVIAQSLGVSDLVIGLTIIAIGTSLPELASTLAAVRKGEHDIALGNIVGSNLFNTLAVIGLAGVIHPLAVEKDVWTRDIPVTGALTFFLFFVCLSKSRSSGDISRASGIFLVACFLGYMAWVVFSTLVGRP